MNNYGLYVCFYGFKAITLHIVGVQVGFIRASMKPESLRA